MRTTIAELVTATETAERAIAGLKTTMREAEQTLGDRLYRAEKFSGEIESQIVAGEDILGRLAKIAAIGPLATGKTVARPAGPDTKAIMAAAQAFAERSRARAGPRGMMRLLREFRLIPIVLVATGCLFALKIAGLMLDGGYLFGPRNNRTISLASSSQMLEPQTVTLDGMGPKEKPSWMRELFGYPNATSSVNPNERDTTKPVIVTGSSAAAPPAAKVEPLPAATTKAPEIKPPVVNGQQIQLDGNRPVSAAERSILERLHERRQELDKRARELDMRESMLKEAEQRVNAQMKEIKETEVKEGPNGSKKDGSGPAPLKTLAVMYENMKPKDAAKIFDRLDIKVLLDMSSQINPRKMSEILAQMSPDAAERLTMEIANRANGGEKAANTNSLPKIEGRPNGS